MSTATQRPQQAARPQQSMAASLLDQILDQPVSERMRAVSSALEKRIHTVEEVLPDSLKSQAARLVKRAELTFARKPELHECEPASLVRCVVEAAEIGLAIDGKLCYAVKYGRKISKRGEPDKWINEAQLQIDYKGLIVVARRSGQIIDAYGDVVCRGDRFEAHRSGPESVLNHTYDFDTERGEVIGAYAMLLFDRQRWRYEMMPVKEIEGIRKRSKAATSGPWMTDWNQMAVKTVLRRALKLYCDDPAVGMALEIDEREYEGERADRAPSAPRVGRSALNDTLAIPPKTVDRSAVPSQRQNQERVREMEEHFGGSSDGAGEPDDSAPNMVEIESAFADCADAGQVEALYDSLKGPEATGEFTQAQNDEIETLKVLALQRIKGGKKQKELT